LNKILESALWGLLSGSALLIGSLFGYYFSISQKVVGGIMAYGSGVLISALSFDLLDEAFQNAGIGPIAIGFLGGSIIYSVANYLVNQAGGVHRKRSGSQQKEIKDLRVKDSSLSIAIGSLIDGIPESLVIGISMLAGEGVSVVAVIAIFLSNIPEGLSSTAGMKKAGRSKVFIFGIWGGIALLSGISALLGYTVFSQFGVNIQAGTTAVAAGAILTMVANTMLPEAYENEGNTSGFITVIGFLTAFFLSKYAV